MLACNKHDGNILLVKKEDDCSNQRNDRYCTANAHDTILRAASSLGDASFQTKTYMCRYFQIMFSMKASCYINQYCKAGQICTGTPNANSGICI